MKVEFHERIDSEHNFISIDNVSKQDIEKILEFKSNDMVKINKNTIINMINIAYIKIVEE